jgi:phosphoenolpyruvate synthase/pyruvate phosphate dikinase
MTIILKLEEITEQNRHTVGGKAYALSPMSKKGFRIPEALCLGVDLYHQYMESSGLVSFILMELYRKPFKESFSIASPRKTKDMLKR